MMYAPQDREVMNINTGRRMYMQGVRRIRGGAVGNGVQPGAASVSPIVVSPVPSVTRKMVLAAVR
jgi:hypothetical protein